MKNIFNTLLLLFLVTSCSKDDDAPVIPPTAEIPAESKFIQVIDRDAAEDLAFDYNSDKKVKYAWIGHRIQYEIEYYQGRIEKITVGGGSYPGIYDFSYNAQNQLTGWYRASDNLFFAIVYFPEENSKKGVLTNTNAEIVKYLLFINRDEVLWTAFIGTYPATQIIYPTGAVAVANTYDSQGFVTGSHMDFDSGASNAVFNYIQL
ncbi:MAG TPA: hypothetical protein VK528_13265 [Flavobacterium sp.]|nr:hypothetical protein [Flavobacterium sp.]